MALPSSGKCCVLAPVLLVLAAGLLYHTGCAFRIRDHAPANSDAVCHSGRCTTPSSPSASSSPSPTSWSNTAPLRAKRGFEAVSARGSFAKIKQQRPPDEPDRDDEDDHVSPLRKDKIRSSGRPWSKLSKIEDEDDSGATSAVDEEEDDSGKIDSDDEMVQIEVEDEDQVIIEDEGEDKKLREKQKREEERRKREEEEEKEIRRLAREMEEKRKKEKEEEERRKREKEEQERRKREEEEKRRKEKALEEERTHKAEEERKRKEKELEERRKREEEERRRKAEEERQKKEEAERRLKEEAERRLREEDERRQREEEEQRLKEEEERRLKKEEERRLKEEEERRKKVEEERRKKEEQERHKKEEEERRKKAEEERRKKEAEERRKKEEEERQKKEAEEQRKKEEEERRKKEAEERRKKEEEERRKKLEEEGKRKKMEEERRIKEEEERRKNKEEEERKRKEKEEKVAELKRKEKEEDERRKKEREEEEAERKRDEEEDRKRLQRVKKEAEEKKKREEEERRKRAKLKANDNEDDDDEDEEEDDEDSKEQRKLEKVRLADKDKAKASIEALRPKPTPSAKAPKDSQSVKPTSAKPSLKTSGAAKPEEAIKTKSKQTKKATSDETKATKPRPKLRGPEVSTLSLAELNDMILSVPTFVPNFTAVEDPACQQHGKIFLRQLRGYKLWALQMLDSSAKIPAGLLRGNVNQLGDFDQCLGVVARVKVEEKTVKVQGKYCLANVDLYASHPALKLPVNLMQSRALIRGNMRDPGHFVPRFTTVNWALCLPAACSAEDARKSVEDALENYNATVGIRFVVGVDPDMCYVKQKSQSYSKETIGVLYFYAMFVCLAIVATLRDYFATLQEKGNYSERIIMAFSFKRTLKALFGNKEAGSSDIGCIHGIRSLTTIALYVAHKMIPMSRIPYANRVSLTEVASNPLSSILRASLFYTDSFLLLSGVLTAYNMAKELSNRGEIRWFCRFIARFIRLTPSLLAVVFWYAFVMEHTGSGPQWNAAVKANADICKENAWINLLYVQNFFPFEEMCATHTHQLALDMQLSLAAPALVFFLQIKPILGIIVVFFLLQVSATLRYLATTNNNLSLVIFHGISSKHLYKTANLTYTLPLHRATPYLFGVSLGVLLHYTGKNVRIHKVFALLGWLIALVISSWSLFSPWRLARRDYVYDVEEATHYAVISPILTALALSWTIFACSTNNGGIINRLLSSYWMVVFSKLSYAIYLSQFAVFFYNVGTTRYSSEFQLTRAIDPFEAMSVASVSVVLTLLFDIPMQEVKNIIMECSDTLSIETEKSKDSIHGENRNNIRKNGQDLTTEDEEEPAPGGWNWNRGTFTKVTESEPREYEDGDRVEEPYRSSRLKRQDIRRQTMIRSEAYDEWDGRGIVRRASRSEEHSTHDDGRTSRSDYRSSNAGLEDDLPSDNYLHPRERYFSSGYTRSPMRDLDAPILRRSLSRERPTSKEREIQGRDYGKKPLITISNEEDYQISRSPRSSMPRFSEQQRSLSSESELEGLGSRRNSGVAYGRRSAEPRISDEDDWEEDLRIRRNRYLQERVSSQERDRIPPPVVEEEVDEEWDSLKRRSSAEGKLALLKEPARPGNMELWTVSKMQLGSSQEPDEDELDEELYQQQRREYREQGPPLREEFEGEEEEEDSKQKSYASESLPTSFEEEEDVANYDFVLKKDSKRITVQDLSKLPSEDEPSGDSSWNKLDVKSGIGLFKRESIVKSQASEEDPEYLIPERPKLVEQEQEHPFKKAWQMQKSRSEEEGPGGFVVKETKSAPSHLEKQKEEPEEKSEEEPDQREGAQSEDGFASPDVTCDVTLVWQARSQETEDNRSSKSSSSSRFDLPDDHEEQLESHRNRRKSEEDNWTWTERDT